MIAALTIVSDSFLHKTVSGQFLKPSEKKVDNEIKFAYAP